MPSTVATNTAAIIINYNGWRDTLLCLQSVLQADVVPAYLMVVDNHSTDDSYEQIYRWGTGKMSPPDLPEAHPLKVIFKDRSPLLATFQAVTESELTFPAQLPALFLYRTPRNLGYAGGVNAGITRLLKRSSIQWFWILNNDVLVHPAALNALLRCSTTAPRTGIWGGKLMAFEQPERFQAVGGRYRKCLAFPTHIGQGEIDQGQYDHPIAIDYVVGAAMLVSRQFIEAVGLLNEEYFLYFEELDWAVRGRRAGWNVEYCWESRVYHREGAATGGRHKPRKSELSDFYLIRNRLRFTRKYYPWCLPVVYLSFIGVIARRVLRGQWRRIPKILKILVTHEI